MRGHNDMKIDSMQYKGYKYVPKDIQHDEEVWKIFHEIEDKHGELVEVSKEFERLSSYEYATPKQFQKEVDKIIARKK